MQTENIEISNNNNDATGSQKLLNSLSSCDKESDFEKILKPHLQDLSILIAEDDEGKTIWHFAIRNRFKKVLRNLFEVCNKHNELESILNTVNSEAKSVLDLLLDTGDKILIDLLYKPYPNFRDSENYTLLELLDRKVAEIAKNSTSENDKKIKIANINDIVRCYLPIFIDQQMGKDLLQKKINFVRWCCQKECFIALKNLFNNSNDLFEYMLNEYDLLDQFNKECDDYKLNTKLRRREVEQPSEDSVRRALIRALDDKDDSIPISTDYSLLKAIDHTDDRIPIFVLEQISKFTKTQLQDINFYLYILTKKIIDFKKDKLLSILIDKVFKSPPTIWSLFRHALEVYNLEATKLLYQKYSSLVDSGKLYQQLSDFFMPNYRYFDSKTTATLFLVARGVVSLSNSEEEKFSDLTRKAPEDDHASNILQRLFNTAVRAGQNEIVNLILDQCLIVLERFDMGSIEKKEKNSSLILKYITTIYDEELSAIVIQNLLKKALNIIRFSTWQFIEEFFSNIIKMDKIQILFDLIEYCFLEENNSGFAISILEAVVIQSSEITYSSQPNLEPARSENIDTYDLDFQNISLFRKFIPYLFMLNLHKEFNKQISEFINISWRDSKGNSILHWLAKYDRYDVYQSAMSENPEIKALKYVANHENVYPFMIATGLEFKKVLELQFFISVSFFIKISDVRFISNFLSGKLYFPKTFCLEIFQENKSENVNAKIEYLQKDFDFEALIQHLTMRLQSIQMFLEKLNCDFFPSTWSEVIEQSEKIIQEGLMIEDYQELDQNQTDQLSTLCTKIEQTYEVLYLQCRNNTEKSILEYKNNFAKTMNGKQEVVENSQQVETNDNSIQIAQLNP